MTATKRQEMIILEKVPYIQYVVYFQKKGKEMTKALINLSNEVNVMTPDYAK